MRVLIFAFALAALPLRTAVAGQAKVLSTQGDAVYRPAGTAEWVALSSGAAVQRGDTVMTGAASSAALAFPGGGKLLLHSNSVAVVLKVGLTGGAVSLERGEFEGWIKKKRFRFWRSLTLRTLTTAATVRNAAFRVLVDESGANAWDVFSGKVKVRRPDVWLKLKADEHVGVDKNGTPSPEEYVIGTVRASEEPK